MCSMSYLYYLSGKTVPTIPVAGNIDMAYLQFARLPFFRSKPALGATQAQKGRQAMKRFLFALLVALAVVLLLASDAM